MQIKTVMAAYFSPAGSTKKVTAAVAEGLAESLGAKLREFNWTVKKNREWRLEFGPSDLLVVGVPTYAGRIPNMVMPYIRDNLLVDRDIIAAREAGGAADETAGGAATDNATTGGAADAPVFAVPVVTYGGRAFDNSLAETAGLLKGNGFAIAGGAVMPCEHVFSDLLQPGRPAEDDLSAARAFGKQLGAKILAFQPADGAAWTEPVLPGDYAPEAYYQPRDLDGNPTNFLKALPVLLEDKCIGCGRCQSVCPMASIVMEKCTPKMPAAGAANPLMAGANGKPDLAAMKLQMPAVQGVCIKCHACVKACPQGAWVFEDEAFLRHVKMLTHTYGDAERENEFFI